MRKLQTFGDLSGVFVAGRTPSNELTVVGSDDGETFWRLTGHKEGANPFDSSVR